MKKIKISLVLVLVLIAGCAGNHEKWADFGAKYGDALGLDLGGQENTPDAPPDGPDAPPATTGPAPTPDGPDAPPATTGPVTILENGQTFVGCEVFVLAQRVVDAQGERPAKWAYTVAMPKGGL